MSHVKVQCVVPENIHTPPRRDWKFQRRGGVKGPGISGGGGGSPQKFFLFQTGLNFHMVARKVSLFAFLLLESQTQKK